MKLLIQINGTSWANIANLAQRFSAEFVLTETTAEISGLEDYSDFVDTLVAENPSVTYEYI